MNDTFNTISCKNYLHHSSESWANQAFDSLFPIVDKYVAENQKSEYLLILRILKSKRPPVPEWPLRCTVAMLTMLTSATYRSETPGVRLLLPTQKGICTDRRYQMATNGIIPTNEDEATTCEALLQRPAPTDATQTRRCRRNQRCCLALIQSAPLALRAMRDQSRAVIRVATHTGGWKAHKHADR